MAPASITVNLTPNVAAAYESLRSHCRGCSLHCDSAYRGLSSAPPARERWTILYRRRKPGSCICVASLLTLHFRMSLGLVGGPGRTPQLSCLRVVVRVFVTVTELRQSVGVTNAHHVSHVPVRRRPFFESYISLSIQFSMSIVFLQQAQH
ncbi:hypothetical protein BJV78DRAFT_636409 [Lactifluus subvellereus]|nr:hypothetical protein BJV78DRAFT_636409 [Lactifluus subvellereus]